jgi:hypothetical protein
VTLAHVISVVASLTALQQEPVRLPFAVGERAVYEVEYGIINAGRSSIEVGAIDTVRGRPAYRFEFVLNGGVRWLGLTVRDTLTSWVDTAKFESLRYVANQDELGKERFRHYEIFGERGVYVERGREETPTVASPLDEISFLYFVRTLDLEVGRTYDYPRYFKPQSNPVTLRVLRTERVKVPAGEFSTIVVQPIFKTRGIFSKDGRAEVWISTDSVRSIVQIKSSFGIARLNLKLRSFTPGKRPGAPPPPSSPLVPPPLGRL